MYEVIELLPKKEQKQFISDRLPELIEVYQKVFNNLAIAFVVACTTEPELILDRSEDTRESLSFLDEALSDMRELVSDNERLTKQAIQKSDR